LNKIVIIGARIDGHAKVVLEILLAQQKYEVAGFIDDNLFGRLSDIKGFPLLGTMNDLPRLIAEYSIDGGIAAIGDNPVRRRLTARLLELGLQSINVIHPTAQLDASVKIGKGNVISQNVVIIADTVIGNCVNIHAGVTIDHDNIIEDGANLGPGVHTAGRVKIRRDAFMGTGSIAIPDAVIGEGSVVGAGAVVLDNVGPYTLVVGVPAKYVKHLKQF
jgi:sugar O-acyltransferase (sialic acid O-acetyltransferase NeuD family)